MAAAPPAVSAPLRARWRWLPPPDADLAPEPALEAWRRVAAAAAVGGVLLLPAARGITAVGPAAVAVLSAAYLAVSLGLPRIDAARRRPAAARLLRQVLELGIVAALPALGSRPWSMSWLLYIALGLALAQEGRPSRLLLGVIAAVPLLVGALWAVIGAVPLSASSGAVLIVSGLAVALHVIVANPAAEARHLRMELGQQRAADAAFGEREALAGILHGRLGALLAEISARLDALAAIGPPEGGLQRAQQCTRRALAELRACVSSLDRGEIAGRALEHLLTARLEELGAECSTPVALRTALPASLPSDAAYHLLALAEDAARFVILETRPALLRVGVEQSGDDAIVCAEGEGAAGAPGEHFAGGFSRLRAQVEALGGRVELSPDPGHPRLVIRAPLARTAEAA